MPHLVACPRPPRVVRLGLMVLLASSGLLCVAAPAAGRATIIVDTLADDGSDPTKCQLRWAIAAANNDVETMGCSAGNGEDTIEFSVQGFIALTSELPEVMNESLHIQGPGRSLLTLSGQLAHRLLSIHFSVPVASMRDMTLAYGNTAFNGGCLEVSLIDELVLEDIDVVGCNAQRAGGVRSSADHTTIRRVFFQGNQATDSSSGALVTNDALIEDSTFASNTSTSSGGALVVTGTSAVTIRRSTFHGNQAGGRGGAILLTQSGVLTLEHSTISGNTADLDDTDIATKAGGGLSVAAGTLNLFNTIIAGNFDANTLNAPDIEIPSALSVNTLGYNLIGNSFGANFAFPAGFPNSNNDYVGFSATSAGTTVDPQLGPLTGNGGPTPTVVPASAQVIDQGSCGGQVQDQRGYFFSTGVRAVDEAPTNADDGCDIGAVEVGAENFLFRDGFESGDLLVWQ